MVNKFTITDKKRSIKGRLADAGIKQIDIARGEGVSTSLVSEVAARKKRSARIELAIARALDLPVDALFPRRNHTHREAA